MHGICEYVECMLVVDHSVPLAFPVAPHSSPISSVKLNFLGEQIRLGAIH